MESAIALPFRFINGGVAVEYGRPEIWRDRVFIAVTTVLQERVMEPTYGTGLLRAVFEPTPLAVDLIKDSIKAAFAKWLPSLTLDSVDADGDPANGITDISVKYTLPNAQQEVLSFKTSTFNRYGEIVRG